MELLILIIGVVVIWKFSSSINVSATASKAHVETWAEKIIADAVIERQSTYEQFLEDTKNADGTQKKIVSHETLLKAFEGK